MGSSKEKQRSQKDALEELTLKIVFRKSMYKGAPNQMEHTVEHIRSEERYHKQ